MPRGVQLIWKIRTQTVTDNTWKWSKVIWMKWRLETYPFIRIRANPTQKQNYATDNTYSKCQNHNHKDLAGWWSNINKNLHLEMRQDSLLVQRLATGWTVQGLNSGGGKIFCTHPNQPCGPPSLLHNGYQVLPQGKLPGCGIHHPAPSSTNNRYIGAVNNTTSISLTMFIEDENITTCFGLIRPSSGYIQRVSEICNNYAVI